MKLGEVGEYVRGLTYGTDDVQDTGTIVIRANNLNDGCPIDFKTELVHVSILPDPHQILRNTDITICMANGSSHLVGKASYCCDASLGTITVGAFCGIFRSTNDLVRWIFQTPTYKRYIYKAIQGGNGAIANLKGDDILNQSYFLPSLPEQKKIAGLLSAIDERIEVQNAIIKEREAQKAALLRRLFDRTLRFPEFTDEWTQTTIGEICKVSTGEMNTQDKIEDGMYPFYVRSSKIERANRYTYDGVAILTPGDGAIGQIFHYSKGKIAVHQRVYMLTEMQCIPKYLFHCFSARFFGRVNRMSAKNTVDSVRMNMITDMPIPLPSLPEQRKIAALLSAIDERLDVERAYAEQLKQQKAYLLRQMFI